MEQKPKKVPFRMHPRVIAALGADLVTNDVVAIIELVKNSYDAFASTVNVRFGVDNEHGDFLEILDDGHGMTRKVIEEVWCLVATPYRVSNSLVRKGKKERRVAGEKGLGRLAAARLGTKLEMVTKAQKGPHIKVTTDWSAFTSSENTAASYVTVSEIPSDETIGACGTRVRIYGLKSVWDEVHIQDLNDNLARLISPFAKIGDFDIFLTLPQHEGTGIKVRVESPMFLSKPKYSISGHVNAKGNVQCRYQYSPITKGKPRSSPIKLNWTQIYGEAIKRDPRLLSKLNAKLSGCGPFEFEIRGWDIGPHDTEEISEKFDLKKNSIRKAIGAHKGISVYRDDILVLPKSEGAKDWLGLDLRRVSKVGTRMSTSQLVGYVGIGKKGNPGIEDTSDRERLVANPEVIAFEEILKAIISQLENERDEDKLKPGDDQRLINLFDELSAEELLAEMVEIANDGASAADALPVVREFSNKLDHVRATIEKRFEYYSRLATVGTIAQMLIHEIRHRTTVIGRFISTVAKYLKQHPDKKLASGLESTDKAVDSLEQLADTFSPLASRSFRRRKRDSLLEESIDRTLSWVAGEIKHLGVKVRTPKTKMTRVAVDPGELDAIISNLISNALYWTSQKKIRKLEFRITRIKQGKWVRVYVDDSGPGFSEKDIEKVFWPGVTKKPGGIGMGLTVASELVAEYGGEMFTICPGKLGGASFAFELPIKK